MKVSLTPLQLKLLLQSPETSEVVGRFLRDGSPPFLEGQGLPLAEFRELCADIVNSFGFDENYDLNSEGRAMEDLVDKLFEP
jgi:hypothetical protein